MLTISSDMWSLNMYNYCLSKKISKIVIIKDPKTKVEKKLLYACGQHTNLSLLIQSGMFTSNLMHVVQHTILEAKTVCNAFEYRGVSDGDFVLELDMKLSELLTKCAWMFHYILKSVHLIYCMLSFLMT